MDLVTYFSTAHIGGTAALCGVLAAALAYWVQRPRSWLTAGGIGFAAAIATFGWRLAANMPQLNRDGFPGFSANDLMAPVVTYVLVGIYASIRPPEMPVQFSRLRSLLVGIA
ncbi:MAG: hypothetical protein ACRD1G_18755, partial [Acidimicrobiales bacterium]